MGQQVTINGKKFRSSAKLARQFGYSMDYISRLAREGKVEATRIGRQWFVEDISLENFLEQVSKQKELSREKLRNERKLELISYTKTPISFSNAEVPINIKSTAGVLKNYLDIVTVATGSTLVLIAGLLSAVALDTNVFLNLYSNFDIKAVPISLPPQNNSDVTAGAIGSRTESKEEIKILEAAEEDKTNSQGMVLFNDRKSQAELEQIKASFSDEVEINFESEDTGVITPIFLEHKGDDYQFLMVPIDDVS